MKAPELAKNVLADTDNTADMAVSQKPGKNESAHVCQKLLAELADTADLAEKAEM